LRVVEKKFTMAHDDDKKTEKPKVAPKAEETPIKKPEPRGGIDDLNRIVAMIERAVETNQV